MYTYNYCDQYSGSIKLVVSDDDTAPPHIHIYPFSIVELPTDPDQVKEFIEAILITAGTKMYISDYGDWEIV